MDNAGLALLQYDPGWQLHLITGTRIYGLY